MGRTLSVSMKVVVTNTVLMNGGDAAILIAIRRQIRRALGDRVEIYVMDSQSERARVLYPELNIIEPPYVDILPRKKGGFLRYARGAARYARWYLGVPRLYAAARAVRSGRKGFARRITTRREWQAITHLHEADLVIGTGGTYLVENYWLGPTLLSFRIALLLGKPLVLYTQSLGPFVSWHVRRTLRNIFRSASLILLRDKESMSNLLELCSASEVHAHLASDVAFSFADPDDLAQARRRPEKPSGIRVAISVREWPYFRRVGAAGGMETYANAVADTAEYLIAKHDASITFLSTCQGISDYTYDDSIVAQRVVARIGSQFRERVEINGDFHTPDELLGLLRGFDLVVATRMHMAILALVAGVPVIPIAYEFKTRALFERLGMREYVCDIEDVGGHALRDTAQRFLQALPHLRPTLFQKVENERQHALEAADHLVRVTQAIRKARPR